MQQSSRYAATLLPLILLLLALASCGETAKPAAVTSPQKPPAPSPTATPEPHHKVGDTVTRDGFAITLTSAKLIDPASIPQHEQIFPSLKPGEVFLMLGEQVVNTTAKDQGFTGSQLILSDAQGGSFDVQASGIPNVDTSGVGGSVAPGMKQSGTQAYIVPKTTLTFYLSYHATTGTIAIWDIKV